MKTRPKILLVDDDPDLLELYRETLAELQCRPEVQTATSGPPALAMLEAEPFDLLICNLRMPKMHGLQVMEIVRRKWPQLLTMILTGGADEQIRARAYAMGVDLFCEKQEGMLWVEKVVALLARERGGSLAESKRSAPKQPEPSAGRGR